MAIMKRWSEISSESEVASEHEIGDASASEGEDENSRAPTMGEDHEDQEDQEDREDHEDDSPDNDEQDEHEDQEREHAAGLAMGSGTSAELLSDVGFANDDDGDDDNDDLSRDDNADGLGGSGSSSSSSSGSGSGSDSGCSSIESLETTCQLCIAEPCWHSDCETHKDTAGLRPECRRGSKCDRLETCAFSHPAAAYPQCPHGHNCMRHGCPWQHQIPSLRRKLCPDGQDCAAWCCTFVHPERGLLRAASRALEGDTASGSGSGSQDDTQNDEEYDADEDPAERTETKPAKRNAKNLFRKKSQKRKAGKGDLDLFMQLRGSVFEHLAIIAKTATQIDARKASGEKQEERILVQKRTELLSQLEAFEVKCETTLEEYLRSKEGSPQWRSSWHRLHREMYRIKQALPALAVRQELEEHLLQGASCFVVKGATGSGKSTQLAQYLAEALSLCADDEQERHEGLYGRGRRTKRARRVICTQPRKVAAMALANRVKEEWASGDQWHEEVGFHVGGCRTSSSETLIEYVTEEILLQRLIRTGDEALLDVDAVILDEAHERSIKMDLLLGVLRMRKQSLAARKNPHKLYLMVTSATLDEQLFADYLGDLGGGDCPDIQIDGRMYPVTDIYLPTEMDSEEKIVESVVEKVLEIHREKDLSEGDVLAFLPDPRTVERAVALFQHKADEGKLLATALPLHGQMESLEQQRVFEALPGRRKVVFANSVAETSITIDGVRFVVDSGLEKRIVFDPKRNVSALERVPISQSSAVQRRGRAGRTAEGVCYRLYSEEYYTSMAKTQVAEIKSQPISLTYLTIVQMGLDPETFPWLESPDVEALISAKESLKHIEAIVVKDGKVELTEFGKLAAHLQIDPNVAKVLDIGHQRNLLPEAQDVAAILLCTSGGGFFCHSPDERERHLMAQAQAWDLHDRGDLFTYYYFYRSWLQSKAPENYAWSRWLRNKTLELIKKTSQDLGQQLEAWFRLGGKQRSRKEAARAKPPSDEQLSELFLAGCLMKLGVVVANQQQGALASVYSLPWTVGSAAATATAAATADFKPPLVTIGHIFPGSTLAREEEDQPERGAPQIICFNSMLQTSKLFLHGVMTVRAATTGALVRQIRQISATFADHLQKALTESRPKKVEQTGFTRVLLSGDRARQLRRRLQEKLGCAVMIDFQTSIVSVWCHPRVEECAQKRLQDELESARSRAKSECSESLTKGSTRVAYGAGGQVQTILFGQQCLRLNIHTNCSRISEAEFVRFIEGAYGPIRDLSMHSRPGPMPSTSGRITFVEKKDAQKALLNLQRDSQRQAIPGLGEPGEEQQRGHGGHEVRAFFAGNVVSTFSGRVKIGCYVEQALRPLEKDELAEVANILEEHIPALDLEYKWEPFVTTLTSKPLSNKVAGAKDNSLWSFRVGISVSYLGSLEAAARAFRELSRESKPMFPTCMRLNPIFRSIGAEDSWKFQNQLQLQATLSISKEAMDLFYPACEQDVSCPWSDCPKRHSSTRRRCRGRCRGEECRFTHPHRHPGWPSLSSHGGIVSAIATCEEDLNCRVSQKERGRFVRVLLLNSDLEALMQAHEVLSKALIVDPVSAVDGLFFQKPGLRRTQELAQEMGVVAEPNFREQTLRVYSKTAASRRGFLRSLEGLQQELTSLQRSTLKLQQKALAEKDALESACRHCGIQDFEIFGSILSVWGKSEGIASLRQKLLRWKWAREPVALQSTSSDSQDKCGLCMDDFDDETVQLSLCAHRFCKDCLRGSWSDLEPRDCPLRCPYADNDGRCSQEVCWGDISAVCPAKVQRRLTDVALNKYMTTDDQTEAVMCPGFGCGHILPRPSGDDEIQEHHRMGGHPLPCDQCGITYCFTCSSRRGRPVRLHPELACNHELSTPEEHRNIIVQELLTLRCPRRSCRQPFLDFDGCPALTCSHCNCHFCAKCLKECRGGSGDAHVHCGRCRGYNGMVSPGLAMSLDEFARVNLARETDSVRGYLDALDPEVRQKVIDACEEDFRARPGGGIVVEGTQ